VLSSLKGNTVTNHGAGNYSGYKIALRSYVASRQKYAMLKKGGNSQEIECSFWVSMLLETLK
jgi:hypothetical protein